MFLAILAMSSMHPIYHPNIEILHESKPYEDTSNRKKLLDDFTRRRDSLLFASPLFGRKKAMQTKSKCQISQTSFFA
jgi:hypothetical protein